MNDKTNRKNRGDYYELHLRRLALLAIAFLVALGILAGLSIGLKNYWVLAATLVFEVIGCVLTDRYLISKLNNLFKGMRGEVKVSAVLQTLHWHGFRSVNGINIPGHGNIDHVIVGPTGVWAIETKHRVGTFEVTGDRLTRFGKPCLGEPLKQAYAEARRVQDLLASKGILVQVRAVLCFSTDDAQLPFDNKMIAGVQVVGYRLLTKLVDDSGLYGQLDQKQIEAIHKELLAFQDKTLD